MSMVTVAAISFRNWSDAQKISNGICELILVPSINRVMAFSLAGGANLLWVSPDANGQTFPQDDSQWHNLGGDKIWPTEQALWQQYTGRAGWPPPHAFDCGMGHAESIPGGVRLTSRARVHIRQWFDKRQGAPVPLSLWNITQVCQPDLSLLPPGTVQDGVAYRMLGGASLPECVSEHAAAIALQNSADQPQKIGVTPAAAQGQGWVATLRRDLGTLFVQSHRLERDAAYPDGDCHADIYSADAASGGYVEMELLSPLRMRKTGEPLRHDITWEIVRVTPEVAADAAKAGAAAGQAALDAR